jgi:hypothetical protein
MGEVPGLCAAIACCGAGLGDYFLFFIGLGPALETPGHLEGRFGLGPALETENGRLGFEFRFGLDPAWDGRPKFHFHEYPPPLGDHVECVGPLLWLL